MLCGLGLPSTETLRRDSKKLNELVIMMTRDRTSISGEFRYTAIPNHWFVHTFGGSTLRQLEALSVIRPWKCSHE